MSVQCEHALLNRNVFSFFLNELRQFIAKLIHHTCLCKWNCGSVCLYL